MIDQPTLSDSAVPEHSVKKVFGAEPAAPARVMSIHAHPDDQEFTVAGTWRSGRAPAARSFPSSLRAATRDRMTRHHPR